MFLDERITEDNQMEVVWYSEVLDQVLTLTLPTLQRVNRISHLGAKVLLCETESEQYMVTLG